MGESKGRERETSVFSDRMHPNDTRGIRTPWRDQNSDEKSACLVNPVNAISSITGIISEIYILVSAFVETTVNVSITVSISE